MLFHESQFPENAINPNANKPPRATTHRTDRVWAMYSLIRVDQKPSGEGRSLPSDEGRSLLSGEEGSLLSGEKRCPAEWGVVVCSETVGVVCARSIGSKFLSGNSILGELFIPRNVHETIPKCASRC